MIVLFCDVLLYDNDILGLVARHRHASWLYRLFAVNVRVDRIVFLDAFKVKSSSPHIQLHTIGGLPKVLKLHCKVNSSPSSTDKELSTVRCGSVGGLSKHINKNKLNIQHKYPDTITLFKQNFPLLRGGWVGRLH